MVVVGLNGSKMTDYNGTLRKVVKEVSLLHSTLSQMAYLITFLRNGTFRVP